jgi:serine/threonine protein kinase
MYTPGFASPEQYHRRELLGPWSDIYSVGASMFACLAAAAPPPADQRLDEDRYIPAKKIWGGEYSDQLLETIDWCLRLDHLERPQSVFALQKVLMHARDPLVRRNSLAADLRGMISRLAKR